MSSSGPNLDATLASSPLPPPLDRAVPDTESVIIIREGAPATAEGALWGRQVRRRSEILRQARVLLGHGGFAAFSIRRVAERSSVAPQTVYNFLGDRDNVLEAAIGQHVSAMIAAAHVLGELNQRPHVSGGCGTSEMGTRPGGTTFNSNEGDPR